MNRRGSLALLLLAAAFLPGCLATQQEIEDLRADIVKLQSTLTKVQNLQSTSQNTLQGSQADVLSQMSNLSRNLEILSTNLQESQGSMSQLSSRLDDLDKNLTYRLDAITEGISKSNASNSSGKNGKEKEGKSSSSAPPTPSALFNQAYGDYTRRKYDAAMGGFQVYLEKYGDTAKASEAQYYIGESQFAKGDWWKALEAYDAVLVNHGKSNIAPSAYIQKGVTLEKLNKESEAMAVYDAIVRKYPNRKEAQTAKARLDALKGGAAEESPR